MFTYNITTVNFDIILYYRRMSEVFKLDFWTSSQQLNVLAEKEGWFKEGRDEFPAPTRAPLPFNSVSLGF